MNANYIKSSLNVVHHLPLTIRIFPKSHISV